MSAVHWSRKGRYPCGVGRRWTSQTISSTRATAGVTCRSCRRAIEREAE